MQPSAPEASGARRCIRASAAQTVIVRLLAGGLPAGRYERSSSRSAMPPRTTSPAQVSRIQGNRAYMRTEPLLLVLVGRRISSSGAGPQDLRRVPSCSRDEAMVSPDPESASARTFCAMDTSLLASRHNLGVAVDLTFVDLQPRRDLDGNALRYFGRRRSQRTLAV